MQFGTMYEAGALKPHGVVEKARADGLGAQDFDTMVGTGLSGALVIPTLAEAFGKEWAIVRKTDERAHSSSRIEGSIGERWIFVDDLVSSGSTFRRVQKAVVEECQYWQYTTTFVGMYTYQAYGGWETAKECARWADRTPPARPYYMEMRDEVVLRDEVTRFATVGPQELPQELVGSRWKMQVEAPPF
jgi:hypoxanthine phosphoribosyltransferase